MMRSILDALGFLECCKYNTEKELLENSQKQVADLEIQVKELLGQIQELKAINHYQTFELEQKIENMSSQLVLSRSEVVALQKEKRSLLSAIGAYKKAAKSKQATVKK